MGYKTILKHIYSLESSKIKLGLDPIRSLLGKIGNPQNELRCIHIAGTNGKGSVCAMLFYVLKETGYKVGLYTSPHLKKFNERIRINDSLITDKEIVNYFLKLKPYITNQSFFEITTAMAFLHFREKKVDFAVLEVGLGGRLDATNVVTPLISVITNIGLEHTNLLGNTIKKIAFEKAGIIKDTVPVVTGAKGGAALRVIKKTSKERNSPFYLAKKHDETDFKYLNGAFQQENKDIALTAIEILKNNYSVKINEKQIINGLRNTKWEGRLEFISKNVLVDCAHNPHGFQALKKELIAIKKKKNIKNFIFVMGFSNDKNISEMLKITNTLASKIIFTKSMNEKAAEPHQVLKIFNGINRNKKIKTEIIKNPKKALDYARKIANKNDLVVVTGSIYLVGEMV
ncbi:bifunctional folylpolyglutamate synthase/dihydrofolate synthase [Candidatus Woesearchaeota archaeon]|nr:bifunctional folylpolyglutamate synthase/dihydrofolate synthase [Candidatus Woesearchaeota archaeon]